MISFHTPASTHVGPAARGEGRTVRSRTSNPGCPTLESRDLLRAEWALTGRRSWRAELGDAARGRTARFGMLEGSLPFKVAITESSGFVGSHTTAALIRAGHDVRVLVRSPDKLEGALAPHGDSARRGRNPRCHPTGRMIRELGYDPEESSSRAATTTRASPVRRAATSSG